MTVPQNQGTHLRFLRAFSFSRSFSSFSCFSRKSLSSSSFSHLSGGQQQRVLLARALCATEKVLLLDEPVAGLDQQSSTSMYGLIRDLNREGMTIIMITHDIEDVLQDATHVLQIGHTNRFTDINSFRSGRKEEDHVG